MDSDKSEEEHEVISKQIVDYYRKYSQNKQLPKYFSGTSLSYMPQIVKEDEIFTQTCPTIIVQDASVIEKQLEIRTSETEETMDGKAASPTSSITSNKKLEWDNGADIGYNNCEKKIKLLHKSLSLPILLTSDGDKKDKIVKPSLTSQFFTATSHSSHDDNTVQKQIYSSSSSSSYEAAVPLESSSSNVQSNPNRVSSSSSSIVSTTAYLKNRIGYPDAESTPKVTSDIYKVYNDSPFIPKVKKGIKNNQIILCWTKPILVDCFDNKKKILFDKHIQTSVSAGLSKSVQTGNSLEIIHDNVNKTVTEKNSNQSLIIIHHETESDKNVSSTNTTNDTAASSCNSFKYYKNITGNKLERSSVKSDLGASTDSSKENPVLGQLITEKQSKDLIKDVNRSIELLQKLLKSKKYDPVTKKRYIKKIVDKIVDNKYSGDSTTSSELFVPKKQENGTNQNKSHEKLCRPPQVSKFTVNTFNDEFLPNNVSQHIDKITVGDSTSSNLHSGNSLEKKENVSSGSYQSWKDDKTLSERLLEEKQKGQGDHLVKFAMKERQHQISWINDEISHLTKLKYLLEKKMQKTTTVYMVSNVNSDENSCCCSNPSGASSRNYVIQTELSGSSSKEGADFNYNDKYGKRNYHVKELTSKKEEPDMMPRRVVSRDIEVVSDDNTTNIKIKTTNLGVTNQERFEVKPPTLVGSGKYDTFPRSRTEQYRFGLSGVSRSTMRPHTNGDFNGRQYSVDLPLSGLSNLEDRINGIVNRYTKRTSADRTTENRCDCRDLETNKILSEYSQKPDLPNTKMTERSNASGYKSSPRYGDYKNGNGYKRADTHGVQPHEETEKLTSRRKSLQEKIVTESSSDKSVHCKCGCAYIQRNVVQKKISQESSSDKRVQCKCGCTCLQSKLSQKKITPLSDKYVQCKCGCPCMKKDSTDVATQNDESVQYTFDIPLNTLATDSSDKMVQCGCVNGVNKNTIDINLQTGECNCCHKELQTSLPLKDDSDQSRSDQSETSAASESCSCNSETVTSTTESVKSCLCCKRRNVTAKYLYSLRKKLSDQVYPLCRPCYRQNRRANYGIGYYSTPGHVCNCYTVVQTTTLNEIKRTINDLNALDCEYCTCADIDNQSNGSVCNYCKYKLRKTSRNSNGIAYTLTFENESLCEAVKKKKHKKKPYLEEIKIKIPVAYKKKHKDKENIRKKARKSYDSEETSTSGTRKNPTSTLQEYLRKNRPEFVEEAEERRKTVKDSKIEREELSEQKKLMFLKNCQEYCEKNAKKLFSEKEMKEITRRNYKKLPEVQQKLNNNREKQLRKANRLIADTFNKKLRENVLQGKRNLPTCRKVVDL